MQIGLWDESLRKEKLSKLGDNLERLNKAVDWEQFRPVLNKALRKEKKGAGGRPAFDYVLMFKILVLQQLYNLSDDQTEYQINDRISFMRFLGLGLGSNVPDAKTIWLFRDSLTKAHAAEALFAQFNKQLEKANLITRSGTIVDATFVEAPRQHNDKDEKKTIKEGRIPEDWEKPENANKRRQKDTDASWTKKRQDYHFGYKNHIKADADSKLITGYAATTASTHDSKLTGKLISAKEDKIVYADSAYWKKDADSVLPEGVINMIHEKGTKSHPLTEEQKVSNRKKSQIRCRVEHIFGFMAKSMHGKRLRSVGIQRAEFWIGMTNLTYNLCRYEFLVRPVRCNA